MPQSLSKIYIHLVFHVKTTSPIIRDEDLERVHSYIGQLVNTTGCKQIRAGGVGDHVHLLLLLSREVTISQVVEEVKRNSSRWIKTLGNHYLNFAWQGGYAAFSVSQSIVDNTIEYINRQREHHKGHTFEEEYRKFLNLYGVEYDERYIFAD